MMGRPFSQHDDEADAAGAFVDVCERDPGLKAPGPAPVAEPTGLSEGAFVAEIGD